MPASGETTPTGDQMQPGEVLRPGDSIRSVNGRFRFGMKADGTLALTNDFGRELWKAPHSGALCVMQGDGNLVIYSASSQAQWASNTSHDAGSHLVVQDDGNVVIYRPDGSSPWATRTVQPELPNGPSPTGSRLQSGEALHWGESIISPSGRYNVSFQSDGNLVLYKAGGTALWSSQTFHNPAAICLMEPGGNFVLYNDLAQVVLSLGTNGNPGAYLEIQDDGNFVLYRPDRQPVWSSKTVQPDGPRATGDQMLAGEALHPTESLVSANGKYTFALQEDGNLVLYANGAALWSSRTSQKPSAVCVMQHDGNLVLYDDHGSKLWASETSHDSESHLVVQDDGNVVIYRTNGTPSWSTHTVQPVLPDGPSPTGSRLQSGEAFHPDESIVSSNKRYRVSFQTDGNLVLYKDEKIALWSSQTAHNPAAVCLMRTDGNFVLYNARAEVVASFNTSGNPGAYLDIQDDGNFVLYRTDRTPVWSSKTVQPDGPRATGNQMRPGEALHLDESLESTNGRYTFVLQRDGNLVLYIVGGAALWSSKTAHSAAEVCVMQHDGNLVLYDDHGAKIWASETSHDNESHLVVQDDGNVVIYRPNGTPLWDTKTVQPPPPPPPPPGGGGGGTTPSTPNPPSITSWTRLEPRARDPEMSHALEARVRDPLWMLARQWQLGELTGEDAGSPVAAQLRASASPINRVAPAGGKPQPIDLKRQILEASIEAEAPPLDMRLSAEAGLQFLRLLDASGAMAARDLFVQAPAFQIAALNDKNRGSMDERDAAFVDAVAQRVPDGVKLHAALLALRAPGGSLTRLPPAPAIPAALVAKVTSAADAWLKWFDELFAPTVQGTPWIADHFEYSLAFSAATTAGEITLATDSHTGGPIDWDAVAVRPGPGLGAVRADQPITRSFLPHPVSFPGMPAPRFWEMEDGAVDLGLHDAARHDLARLLVAEFGLLYGNDWFLLPIDVAHGSILSVQSLIVTNSFGEMTMIEPAVTVDNRIMSPGEDRWSMFTNPGMPAGSMFFAAPELDAVSGASMPVEEVLLLRDDLAATAWGIEKTIPGVYGPIHRDDRWHRHAPPSQPVAGPNPVWRLGTIVPDYWIPFLPVKMPSGEIRLDRGTVPALDGSAVPSAAHGAILGFPKELHLFEAEVPREGVRIIRSFRNARSPDGGMWLWLSRSRRVGRGEGASGLEFDRLDEPKHG